MGIRGDGRLSGWLSRVSQWLGTSPLHCGNSAKEAAGTRLASGNVAVGTGGRRNCQCGVGRGLHRGQPARLDSPSPDALPSGPALDSSGLVIDRGGRGRHCRRMRLSWIHAADAGRALPRARRHRDYQCGLRSDPSDTRLIGCGAIRCRVGRGLWRARLLHRIHPALSCVARELGCTGVFPGVEVRRCAGASVSRIRQTGVVGHWSGSRSRDAGFLVVPKACSIA